MSDSLVTPALEQPRAHRKWIGAACVLTFAAITLGRVIYVSLYASALPFWDQWDEINVWLRPWSAGRWPLSQLLAPHNEHHIALTRLWDLLLYAINGHTFDNLVNSYANVLPYAGMWTLTYALTTRGDLTRRLCWILALAIMVFGVLPFDWENTLVGFQSAFYFMELTAVGLLGIASYCTPSPRTLVALVVLAIVNLFTMASGVLAAPAVCAVMVFLALQDRSHIRYYIATVGAMVIVTAAGLALIPTVPGDMALHAVGLRQNVDAVLIAMSWPIRDGLWFVVVVWLPMGLWLWRYLRTRQGSTNEIFAAGVGIWVLLQFLAIAHARGGNMMSVTSRYSEISALGVVCNLWLALQLAGHVRRRRVLAVSALVVGIGAIAYAFWTRTPADLAAMVQRHNFTTVETKNVRRYIAGIPLPILPEGSQLLPYPTAARLRNLLDNPEVRALLPPSILPLSDPPRPAPLSRAAAALQRSIRAWFPKPVWVANPEFAAVHSPSSFSAYTGVIPMQATNPQCSLDVINGRSSADASAVAPGAATYFGGWAGNGNGAALDHGLFILKGMQQSFAAPFATGVMRPDVAQALNSEGMARSGYNLTATLDGVEAGTYSLFVADFAHPSVWCDLHRTLTVN